ncbi:Uncharacterised protein [uncultured archaeon]|nr:Uncharacterised protein [uncultured archaeon]
MARTKGYTAVRPRNGASFIDIARAQLGLATGKTKSGRNFVRGTPAQKRAVRLRAIKLAREDARQEMGKHKANLNLPRTDTQPRGKIYRNNVVALGESRAEQISKRIPMSELANELHTFRTMRGYTLGEELRTELKRLLDRLDGNTATAEDKKRVIQVMLQEGHEF